jgi:tRNA (guanine26-N2/guanine27-N2)-dimethyltransferase
MIMKLIIEQSTRIKATLPGRDPTKKQEVFYNPMMKSNRNISIVLLNSISNKEMGLALPLAGSGIRVLRFLKELKKGKLECLYLNDKKETFEKTIKENIKLNDLKTNKIKISNQDAEKFLLGQHCDEFCGYFDYIDIDPFGTPNPFLSVAVNKIKRNGILAITATDTAALTGTYPKVTKRKYWAKSLRNHLMHEIGLRILIRKVQLQGIQFDKAMVPILSYHKDHYFRIYFRSEKGKIKCDELIKQHQYLLFCPKCLNYKVSNYNLEKCECKNEFDYAGPLWAGKLFDSKLVTNMVKNNSFPEEEKFLDTLKEEAKKDLVGFYDLHVIGKKYKLEPKKMDLMLKKLKGTRTHFSLYGIKTKKGIKEIIKEIKK